MIRHPDSNLQIAEKIELALSSQNKRVNTEGTNIVTNEFNRDDYVINKAQAAEKFESHELSLQGLQESKQNVLTAGNGISINNDIISSTSGSTFGTCPTAAATGTKVVTIGDGSIISLYPGFKITVAFTNANTSSSIAYLNVNGSGAVRIALIDGTLPTAYEAQGLWSSGDIIDFIYDGTYWRIYQKDTNPIGTIIAFAGLIAPTGYALCNGTQSSFTIARYPKLDAAIGTRFGTSTTYVNKPNLTDKTLMGTPSTTGTSHPTLGTSSPGAIPNITGYAGQIWSDAGAGSSSGALYGEGISGGSQFSSGGYTAAHRISIDASRSSELYKPTLYIEPANVRVRFFIKYI